MKRDHFHSVKANRIPCKRIALAAGLFHVFKEFRIELLLFETVLARHKTACRTRRPAVFIIKPCVHAEFFRFRNTGFYAFEPFLAEIFRVQPDAGVHEETAKPHLLHEADLPDQFLRFQFCVPRPERRSAEIRAGRLELLHLFIQHIVFPFLVVLTGYNIERKQGGTLTFFINISII